MGLVQKAFKSSYFGWFAGGFLNNMSRPAGGIRQVGGGEWFYPTNAFNYWAVEDYISDATCIPELAAILSLRSSAFSNGHLIVANEKGEEVDNNINKILKNPNWFQTQKEFLKQTKMVRDIFGNELLSLLFPFGFNAQRTKAIFTIPFNMVKVEYNSRQPFWVHKEAPKEVSYQARVNGIWQELDKDTLIHLNDNRVHVQDGTDKNLLRGESKLKSLRPNTINMKLAYESRGVILKNRGALGILSNDTKDSTGGMLEVDDKEQEKIQAAMRGYGTLSNQNQTIVSNNRLHWVEMSIRPDKLGLYEETREDFNKCLDIFHTPKELFVSEKGSTFENQNQARKAFIENAIIPDANEWTMALNRKFGMEERKEKIIMTYSHLPIFQEDLKERGQAIDTTVKGLTVALLDKAITNEEYREELRKLGIGAKQQG